MNEMVSEAIYSQSPVINEYQNKTFVLPYIREQYKYLASTYLLLSLSLSLSLLTA